MDKYNCSRRLISVTWRRCFWQGWSLNPGETKYAITYTYRRTIPKTVGGSGTGFHIGNFQYVDVAKTEYTQEYEKIVYEKSDDDAYEKHIAAFKRNRWCLACQDMETQCKEIPFWST